jgi:hypothetical protein
MKIIATNTAYIAPQRTAEKRVKCAGTTYTCTTERAFPNAPRAIKKPRSTSTVTRGLMEESEGFDAKTIY